MNNRAAIQDRPSGTVSQAVPSHELRWHSEGDDLVAIATRLKEHDFASDFAVRTGTIDDFSDTYYDTEDWRFYRAGYTLSVRQDDEGAEASMKPLVPVENGFRSEVSETLKDGGLGTLKTTSGLLGERLRTLAGSAELRQLFEVRTRRQTFMIRPNEKPEEDDPPAGKIEVDAAGDIHWKEDEALSAEEVVVDAAAGIHQRSAQEGGMVGEIVLDASEVPGEGGTIHLGRLTAELWEAPELREEVETLVGQVRDSLGVSPLAAFEFELGLSNADLVPAKAPEFGSTDVDASMSAGEVALAILRRHFARMLTHEPGVRLGEDPEELHDMRVATRRLRATLKLYADFLPEQAERLERDLHWAANALGEVRDLDVHLEGLTQTSGGAPEDEESSERIATALKKRRAEARVRMLETLDSDRYERLVSDFSDMLLHSSPESTGTILEVAPKLIQRRHKKVRKVARRLAGDSPPEAFHDLRKKGRRLRYALEPLRGIYGKPVKGMVSRLKAVQDDLGEQQDRVVSADTLRELAIAEELSAHTVFSMGVMAERRSRDAEEGRADFLRSKKLRFLAGTKPRRRLLRSMKERV